MTKPMGALVAPPPAAAWTFPRPTPTQVSALPSRVVLPVKRPPYNQDIGSCTINSSGMAILALSDVPFEPAVRAAYYYARVDSGLRSGYDDGAYPENVAKSLATRGLGSYAAWPDTKDWRLQPNTNYDAQARDHRVLEWYRTATVDRLKLALASGFSVVIAAQLRESFETISEDGMWRVPHGAIIGGHQMFVYGYNDLEVGDYSGKTKGCFTVLQSWGEWGEQVWDHPQYGRGSWRLPYEAFESAGFAYDTIAYTLFDSEAGR